MAHYCHAIGCTTEVEPRMFVCRAHWNLLTPKERKEINAVYVPGQEIRKDPTPEYLEVQQRLVKSIARKEELLVQAPKFDLV